MKFLHPLTHPLHQCPRLSYIYPFPPMSTYYKYFPYLRAEKFLRYIFTCLPLSVQIEKEKFHKPKITNFPYFSNHPYFSSFTSYLIGIQNYISNIESVNQSSFINMHINSQNFSYSILEFTFSQMEVVPPQETIQNRTNFTFEWRFLDFSWHRIITFRD